MGEQGGKVTREEEHVGRPPIAERRHGGLEPGRVQGSPWPERGIALPSRESEDAGRQAIPANRGFHTEVWIDCAGSVPAEDARLKPWLMLGMNKTRLRSLNASMLPAIKP